MKMDRADLVLSQVQRRCDAAWLHAGTGIPTRKTRSLIRRIFAGIVRLFTLLLAVGGPR